MNCIIIEDDKLSLRIIEEFINKTADLNLVHTYNNAVDAINLSGSDSNIQLIFLDIELPDMTGMEFLDSLEITPQVVIISSKDKYAVDAFNYEVTDYLVKYDKKEYNTIDAVSAAIILHHLIALIFSSYQ